MKIWWQSSGDFSWKSDVNTRFLFKPSDPGFPNLECEPQPKSSSLFTGHNQSPQWGMRQWLQGLCHLLKSVSQLSENTYLYKHKAKIYIVLVVWLLSRVQLFAAPWTAAYHASLSFTISWSLLKHMSIELVMSSNHLILCCPLLLPSVFPSIRVFSKESALRIRWPKYWSFSFSLSPSNEYSGLISLRMDWFIFLQSKGLSIVFSNTTVQKRQFFSTQPSLWSNSHIHT